ncbi:MAG TPA: hypothetical protein VJH55_01165 [Candidatus Paceibacterota bacterium]
MDKNDKKEVTRLPLKIIRQHQRAKTAVVFSTALRAFPVEVKSVHVKGKDIKIKGRLDYRAHGNHVFRDPVIIFSEMRDLKATLFIQR